MLLAGYETSANTMVFTLYLLSRACHAEKQVSNSMHIFCEPYEFMKMYSRNLLVGRRALSTLLRSGSVTESIIRAVCFLCAKDVPLKFTLKLTRHHGATPLELPSLSVYPDLDAREIRLVLTFVPLCRKRSSKRLILLGPTCCQLLKRLRMACHTSLLALKKARDCFPLAISLSEKC